MFDYMPTRNQYAAHKACMALACVDEEERQTKAQKIYESIKIDFKNDQEFIDDFKTEVESDFKNIILKDNVKECPAKWLIN